MADPDGPARRPGRVPRWLLAGAWVATLALAVGVSTWAVGLASRQVTDPVAPSVLLGAGSTEAPDPDAGATPSPTPSSGPSSEPGAGPSGGSSATATPRPTSGPTTAPPPPPPTSAPTPTTSPSSPSPQPTAAPAPAETRTVSAVGGRAAFRFEGGRVTLLWATPAAGFEVDTDDEGDQVDVRFRSEDHESRIRAEYRDGQPSTSVEERPDDGGEGGEGDDG